MSNSDDDDDRLSAEIARLPPVFQLRDHPGHYFRVSPGNPWNEQGGMILRLETFSRDPQGEDVWTEHSELSLREVVRQLLDYDGDRRFASSEEVDAYLGEGEQPDLHLLERLEEGPLSVSRIIDGEVVFGHMDGDTFVPDGSGESAE